MQTIYQDSSSVAVAGIVMTVAAVMIAMVIAIIVALVVCCKLRKLSTGKNDHE